MGPQTSASLSLSCQQKPPLLRFAKQNGGGDFSLVRGFDPPLPLCVRHDHKCGATMNPGQRLHLLAACRLRSYQADACNEQQVEVSIHL